MEFSKTLVKKSDTWQIIEVTNSQLAETGHLGTICHKHFSNLIWKLKIIISDFLTFQLDFYVRGLF